MTITVLQWNVYFQEDIHNIAEFLKANPADVICLQELTIDYAKQTVKNTPLYIAEQLGYNYYSQEVPFKRRDGTLLNLTNGIFSRFPIENTRPAWIHESINQNDKNDQRRAYLEATLKIPGSNVTIATTHLSFAPAFTNTPRKKREADDLCKEMSRHDKAFIFTGDLNATPDSYMVKTISKHLKNAGPDPQQKTWTTKPFSYQGFEETQRNWRLDYIFTTKDVKVLKAEILETNYSDHLPIFTKLMIG